MKLIFATANIHKVEEVRQLLGRAFEIITPATLGLYKEIPETGDTLQANAIQKARFIWEKFGIACFGDDTGLEVDALHGAPGVYSARYAGEGKNAEDNMLLLLKNMQHETNRAARFRCVIALIMDKQEYLFEGKVDGIILHEKHGEKGFGYDPIFRPSGYNSTFAEMSAGEKNAISHRGKAVMQLVDFLKNNNTKLDRSVL